MNLMNVKPDRGFYKISITAASVTSTITVKVLSETKLDYLEIGTGDADQTTQPKLTRYLRVIIFFMIFYEALYFYQEKNIYYLTFL